MIQQYQEDDGMDPGLGDLAYDGTEYDLDEFGERVGGDSLYDDDEEADMDLASDPASSDMTETATSDSDATNLENGFGETISPEQNPHIEDQLEDPDLQQAAESDNMDALRASEDQTDSSDSQTL